MIMLPTGWPDKILANQKCPEKSQLKQRILEGARLTSIAIECQQSATMASVAV
jgi:hypothetical protein